MMSRLRKPFLKANRDCLFCQQRSCSPRFQLC
jgi:hypothetical protein